MLQLIIFSFTPAVFKQLLVSLFLRGGGKCIELFSNKYNKSVTNTDSKRNNVARCEIQPHTPCGLVQKLELHSTLRPRKLKYQVH